jgi:hypothetical protein
VVITFAAEATYKFASSSPEQWSRHLWPLTDLRNDAGNKGLMEDARAEVKLSGRSFIKTSPYQAGSRIQKSVVVGQSRLQNTRTLPSKQWKSQSAQSSSLFSSSSFCIKTMLIYIQVRQICANKVTPFEPSKKKAIANLLEVCLQRRG